MTFALVLSIIINTIFVVIHLTKIQNGDASASRWSMQQSCALHVLHFRLLSLERLCLQFPPDQYEGKIDAERRIMVDHIRAGLADLSEFAAIFDSLNDDFGEETEEEEDEIPEIPGNFDTIPGG